MTDREYQKINARKFNSAHTSFKFYLKNDEDADLIAQLQKAPNKSKAIRKLLKEIQKTKIDSL